MLIYPPFDRGFPRSPSRGPRRADSVPGRAGAPTSTGLRPRLIGWTRRTRNASCRHPDLTRGRSTYRGPSLWRKSEDVLSTIAVLPVTRPRSGLSRSDFVHWHTTSVPTPPMHFSYQGYCGRDMLAMSLSALDRCC
jgi:hypothetical protein